MLQLPASLWQAGFLVPLETSIRLSTGSVSPESSLLDRARVKLWQFTPTTKSLLRECFSIRAARLLFCGVIWAMACLIPDLARAALFIQQYLPVSSRPAIA